MNENKKMSDIEVLINIYKKQKWFEQQMDMGAGAMQNLYSLRTALVAFNSILIGIASILLSINKYNENPIWLLLFIFICCLPIMLILWNYRKTHINLSELHEVTNCPENKIQKKYDNGTFATQLQKSLGIQKQINRRDKFCYWFAFAQLIFLFIYISWINRNSITNIINTFPCS